MHIYRQELKHICKYTAKKSWDFFLSMLKGESFAYRASFHHSVTYTPTQEEDLKLRNLILKSMPTTIPPYHAFPHQ